MGLAVWRPRTVLPMEEVSGNYQFEALADSDHRHIHHSHRLFRQNRQTAYQWNDFPHCRMGHLFGSHLAVVKRESSLFFQTVPQIGGSHMASRRLIKIISRLITNWIMMHLAPRIERAVYRTRDKVLNKEDQ